MDFQWYPGHMTKAKRAMQEDIRLVDLVIELLDARAPGSSRNPDIDTLAKGKARLVVLNKADLADESANRAWSDYLSGSGASVLCMDARLGNGKKKVQEGILKACEKKIERDRRRGILNRPVRAMVAGIPNVGKSTFINTLAGRASAKTGNKPGVTRGNQWIRLNKQVELLDTPGILWPKFEDPEAGLKLAWLGSIKEEILNTTGLATELIDFLQRSKPDCLAEHYGILPEAGAERILEQIAEARNCRMKGNEPDTERAAFLLLNDFRSNRLGRITLELPEGGKD
ncbi:MAG: ribosome biogenesis GTPase YlqF [Lachnospiraceae bacterium]|nr:ribosome biogenesis GTPase YlqF [Lachnospiraceae bacterium]